VSKFGVRDDRKRFFGRARNDCGDTIHVCDRVANFVNLDTGTALDAPVCRLVFEDWIAQSAASEPSRFEAGKLIFLIRCAGKAEKLVAKLSVHLTGEKEPVLRFNRISFAIIRCGFTRIGPDADFTVELQGEAQIRCLRIAGRVSSAQRALAGPVILCDGNGHQADAGAQEKCDWLCHDRPRSCLRARPLR
jgi:hypothetical protein